MSAGPAEVSDSAYRARGTGRRQELAGRLSRAAPITRRVGARKVSARGERDGSGVVELRIAAGRLARGVGAVRDRGGEDGVSVPFGFPCSFRASSWKACGGPPGPSPARDRSRTILVPRTGNTLERPAPSDEGVGAGERSELFRMEGSSRFLDQATRGGPASAFARGLPRQLGAIHPAHLASMRCRPRLSSPAAAPEPP